MPAAASGTLVRPDTRRRPGHCLPPSPAASSSVDGAAVLLAAPTAPSRPPHPRPRRRHPRPHAAAAIRPPPPPPRSPSPAAKSSSSPAPTIPLTYDIKSFSVKAGQKLKVTFNNQSARAAAAQLHPRQARLQGPPPRRRHERWPPTPTASPRASSPSPPTSSSTPSSSIAGQSESLEFTAPGRLRAERPIPGRSPTAWSARCTRHAARHSRSSSHDRRGRQLHAHRRPGGRDIPLVITIGKWRRQLNIPNVAACQTATDRRAADTTLPKSMTDMTPNTTRVDMPQIAISTGSADALECLVAQARHRRQGDQRPAAARSASTSTPTTARAVGVEQVRRRLRRRQRHVRRLARRCGATVDQA